MRSPSQTLLDHLRRLTHPPTGDAALLSRWVRERHEDAFAALVARHGPMVYGAAIKPVKGKRPDFSRFFRGRDVFGNRKTSSPPI